MKSDLNKQFVKINFLVSLLCVLCASVVNSSAQEFKSIKDGIEYAEVTRDIAGIKVNMNLLLLDLTKVRLDVHHAMDAAIGTEKTSSIATRHGAFAAINAGFFRWDTSIWAGDAAGILKIDGRTLSESSSDRTAIFISNGTTKTNVDFGHISFSFWIRFGSNLNSDKGIFKVMGINRERKEDELIMFTDDFNRTTLTGPDGAEIIVRKEKITAVLDSAGSSEIPKNGYVLSVSGKFKDEILPWAKTGSKVWLMGPGPYDKGYKLGRNSEDITNGVPQLLRDGKIDVTWEQEKTTKSFVETRHPRTAVAKLKDGKFLMITVDGRSESSGGIGLQDLAEYLLSLGATDAMNLDGGGSTTMFVAGKVVNHPSDKEGERKVSDAILVTPRKKH